MRKLTALLLVLLLAACGSSPPIPDDNYYRLTSRAPFDSGPQVIDTRLAVMPTRATGVRRGRAMLYSEDPGHVRFKKYHYHHWDEAPATLFQRRLVDSLLDSGIAASVIEQVAADTPYRLQTTIVRFDRLVDAESASVLVEIEASLVASNDPLNPVLNHRYSRLEQAQSMSMEDSVVAFSHAADGVIADLIAEMQNLSDL